MARCDVCGNDYDKAFRVTQGDRTMTFDSFECAIHAMAPRCAHCQCRVVGHLSSLKRRRAWFVRPNRRKKRFRP